MIASREEFERLEKCGGILGNFYRRRRVELETRERKFVGRTVPRQVEDSRIGSVQSGFFTKGSLVDERS